MFDNLVGWYDFISEKSDSLIGLSIIANSIKFEFNCNPELFLEFLRMPYFGFWSEEERITSSGAYTIKDFLPNKIVLSLRPDWFNVSQDSIKEVEISFTSISTLMVNTSEFSIISFPFHIQADLNIKSGYWIMSPPTILENFTLSHTKNNFFNNKKNRHIFNERIRSQFPKKIKSDYFYPSAKSIIKKNIIMSDFLDTSHVSTLTFALERNNYSSLELENLNELITFALLGTDIKFEIIKRDLKDQEWFKKTDSNIFFDARISCVDIGSTPSHAAITMMFCTKLGINFPDPSGRICELVSNGIKSFKDIDNSFINQFNQILYDDAVIIPIQHLSSKWFVTNDIDPMSLPKTVIYPQFELIRTKK